MRIETERLLLRPFVREDAADLFAYLHEPTVHCFADMKLHTMDEAVEAVEERMADEAGLYLAIQLKENGRVIGEIFAHAESVTPDGAVKDTWSPCWMLPLLQKLNSKRSGSIAMFLQCSRCLCLCSNWSLSGSSNFENLFRAAVAAEDSPSICCRVLPPAAAFLPVEKGGKAPLKPLRFQPSRLKKTICRHSVFGTCLLNRRIVCPAAAPADKP